MVNRDSLVAVQRYRPRKQRLCLGLGGCRQGGFIVSNDPDHGVAALLRQSMVFGLEGVVEEESQLVQRSIGSLAHVQAVSVKVIAVEVVSLPLLQR